MDSTVKNRRKAFTGNQPAVVKVSGTIETGPVPVAVGTNKSIFDIDGAVVRGGLNMTYGTSNVIIRYLTIIGAGPGSTPDDAISGRGATNVWIDHCDISDVPRRLIDMHKRSDLITVSWTKFSYTYRQVDRISNLIGAASSDGELDRGKLRVTYHHNHFAANVTGEWLAYDLANLTLPTISTTLQETTKSLALELRRKF